MPNDIRNFFGSKGSQGTPSSQERHGHRVQEVCSSAVLGGSLPDLFDAMDSVISYCIH